MAQTATSSTSLPKYVENASKGAIGDIQDWTKSGDNYVYGSKPGETLFTPLTDNQKSSIGNISWLADQNLADLFGTNKAGGYLDQFAGFDPATLSTEKLTDEGGYLGSIESYMSPYLKQVLDPQIREINEALQGGRRDLGAGAQMAGAFGDARHGIMETGLYDTAMQNISDTTGRTYADAWNEAMALRSGDRSAKLAVDTSNRDADIQQNQNLATAATGTAALGQQFKKDFFDVNDALWNAGQAERDANQEQNDAMRAFQEALKNKKYDDAMRILGALNGAPYSTTSKTTQKSDDGLAGLIGAGLGAVFG